MSSQLTSREPSFCVAFSPPVLCSGDSSHHGLPTPSSVFSIHRACWGLPLPHWVLEVFSRQHPEASTGLNSCVSLLSGITLFCFLMSDVLKLLFPMFFRQEDVSGSCYPNIAGSLSFLSHFVNYCLPWGIFTLLYWIIFTCDHLLALVIQLYLFLYLSLISLLCSFSNFRDVLFCSWK